MWRGTLAPRRVVDLVEQLPDDSALAASAQGGVQHRAWDVHTHLLAAAVDAAHLTAWITAQANSRQRVPKPRPLPRPPAGGPGAGEQQPRPLNLSRHPDARPIPEKYLAAGG